MNSIGDLSAIWLIILNNIRDEKSMPKTAIDLWFGSLQLVSLSTDKVIFAVENEMKKSIIDKKYIDYLEYHVENVIGFSPKVEVIVDQSLVTPPENDGVRSPMDIIRGIKNAQSSVGNDDVIDTDISDDTVFNPFVGDEVRVDHGFEYEEDMLADYLSNPDNEERDSAEKILQFNPDYTFENFIVGSSNELAHAGARVVAEAPGKKYNPLFFYGNSGIGKTHLMYAIANEALSKNPSLRVICVKGEEFMNQLIESIRVKKNSEFRDKYRKADMLLIDDIQFIAGKESTQLEFFHTFDALYEDHKQIIITSDKPPHEMVTLEERIRSRFESGLVVDIQPPDFELRLAILQNKATKNNLVIPTDVLTYLAENLQSNVRQMEGVMKQLGAKHFLTGAPITIEMARSTISVFVKENESNKDIVQNIIECVAKRFKTTPEEIYGRKRTKEIKTARNVAMRIIRDMTPLSLPKIGALMGNRDYSTVHSNLQAIDKQVACDSTLESEIADIIREIKRVN